MEEYFPAVQNETASYGLHVDVEEKVKNQYSAIQSAFLKENTRESLLFFYPDGGIYKDIDPKRRIKVKFEVDTHPALGANKAALEAVTTGEKGILIAGVDYNAYSSMNKGGDAEYLLSGKWYRSESASCHDFEDSAEHG